MTTPPAVVRRAEPPSWLVVAAAAVIAIGSVMLVLGAVTVGVTWDERVQAIMLQTFFDQGWHVTPDALLDGQPDPKYFYGTFVYGPVGELLPHLVNVIIGEEALWQTVSFTAEAYAGRHVGIALWAMLGIAGAGLATWLITRSWRWGVLGTAALAVTPLWIGHGMFNIKDLPAATGYTLATVGLIAFVHSEFLSRRAIRLTAWFALLAGAVLAIGTRTALAAPLVMTTVLAFALAWLLHRRQGRQATAAMRLSRRFVEALVTLVAAYLVLLAVYPKAFINPINTGVKAILDSALYPVTEAQLTNGEWMTQPVSWTYLPLWFGAQLPLLVIAGCVLFVVWWFVVAVRCVALRRAAPVNTATATEAAPVGAQLLLLPLGAILAHSTLYNGSRQMLMVVPAAAILAALGVWLAARWASGRRRPWSVALWSAVVVGLVVPMVSQAMLFPYNFTYFNAAAALRPIDGNWPTDYWRASGREMLRLTPPGRESCGYDQLQKGEFRPCSDQSMFEPFLAERSSSAGSVPLADNEYWFIRENNGVLYLPPGCRPFDTIERRLFWQTITIGQIAICDDRIDTGIRDSINPPPNP